MLQIAGSSTQKVLGVLAGAGGLPAAVEALVIQQGIALPAITPQQIIGQNVTPDLARAEHDLQLSVGLRLLQQSG